MDTRFIYEVENENEKFVCKDNMDFGMEIYEKKLAPNNLDNSWDCIVCCSVNLCCPFLFSISQC